MADDRKTKLENGKRLDNKAFEDFKTYAQGAEEGDTVIIPKLKDIAKSDEFKNFFDKFQDAVYSNPQLHIDTYGRAKKTKRISNTFCDRYVIFVNSFEEARKRDIIRLAKEIDKTEIAIIDAEFGRYSEEDQNEYKNNIDGLKNIYDKSMASFSDKELPKKIVALCNKCAETAKDKKKIINNIMKDLFYNGMLLANTAGKDLISRFSSDDSGYHSKKDKVCDLSYKLIEDPLLKPIYDDHACFYYDKNCKLIK